MGLGLKRKKLCWLLVMALMLPMLPTAALAEETGGINWTGDGTQEKPYQISSGQQLLALAEMVTGGNDCSGVYFQLVSDIDLKGEEWIPIGDNKTPFRGSFDGQGHVIKGVTANGDAYNGLFGWVENSTIKNIVLQEGAYIGGTNIGAIAGYIKDSSVIGCSVQSMKFSGTTAVGGVVGATNGESKIIDCGSAADLTNEKISYVGGIVGQNNGSLRIINCFNSGSIAGKDAVGGIVGYGQGDNISLQNCFNKGSLPENGYALLGKSGSVVTINNCYYLEEQHGYPDGNVTAADVVSVSDDGALASPVTIDGQMYTDVTDALNAWLATQNDAQRRWQADGLAPSVQKKYLVQFVSDGEIVSSVQAETGQKLQEPATPSKAGYTFNGWSLGGEHIWQFEQDTVSSDMCLQALWQAQQISVEASPIALQGQVGQALTYDFSQIAVSGDGEGVRQYRLTEETELPAGLSFASGILSGTPSETVQDKEISCIIIGANGTEAKVVLRLTVLPRPMEPIVVKYTIRTTATVGGTVSPERAVVKAGGSQTFVMEAQKGYELADVLLDGQSLGALRQYTLTDIQSDHVLAAQFVPQKISGGGGYDGGDYDSETIDGQDVTESVKLNV